MNRLAFFGFAAVLAFATSCEQSSQSSNPSPSPTELTALEKNIIAADNSFGLKLFANINESQHDKNVFISPFSVSMALGMTLNGANGGTRDSMQNVLELTGQTTEDINSAYQNISDVLPQLDPKVSFDIANSIWSASNFSVEPDFISVNQTYFHAEVSSRDFTDPATVDAINWWVNTNTHGKITTIIDKIDPEAVMFLINAIYFKGTWTFEFDKSKTADAPFYKSDGSSMTCQMMGQKAYLGYHLGDDAIVVDLPYGDGAFSMTIVLPTSDQNIDTFAANVTQEQLDELTGALQKDTIEVYLPKFKLEWEKKLNNELITMGMGIAFDPFRADFTKINRQGHLFISYVKHKTFVQVDEEGTEAAAVTIVAIYRTTAGGPPRIVINRPFLFMIREHETGTILFIGKIVEPKW